MVVGRRGTAGHSSGKEQQGKGGGEEDKEQEENRFCLPGGECDSAGEDAQMCQPVVGDASWSSREPNG